MTDSPSFRRGLLRGLLLFSLSALLPAAAPAQDGPAGTTAKNVILMISDGASWGTWNMAAHWQAGVDDANDLPAYAQLPVRLGVTTFPLNTAGAATRDPASLVGYDPARAWDARSTLPAFDRYATSIAGYGYLKRAYTDSAAAATAMASGVKTYNSAINVDNDGRPVEFISQIARAAGRRAGVVTSVPFSHATPAAFGTQDPKRGHYHAIAAGMLRGGALDLIIGAGHPAYDDDGRPAAPPATADCGARDAPAACLAHYEWIAPADWETVARGRLAPRGGEAPWTLIDDKSAFEQLAAGTRRIDGPLLGVPRVRSTLQEARRATVTGSDPAQPSGAAKIATVPSLATLATAALRHLARDGRGLFLMIEGGAVDWAAHDNLADRMIEEQVDFNEALAAVQAWVERESSWDETLLIVTTDHGNALPLGPDSDRIAFQPVRNAGRGQLPAVRFWSRNHVNELVRLWARGAGAQRLVELSAGRHDAGFAAAVGHGDGSYIDNTDVFKAMKAALGR